MHTEDFDPRNVRHVLAAKQAKAGKLKLGDKIELHEKAKPKPATQETRPPQPASTPKQMRRAERKQSRAERNIAWCEHYLSVPEGQHVGKKLVMPKFHRDDFRAIYNNPNGETRLAIISRGRKNAKSVSLDCPIPTPSGWHTMADIQVGDMVFGSDGSPVCVTATSQLFLDKKCYAVGFSDGSSITASEDHLWTTTHLLWPKPDLFDGFVVRLHGRAGRRLGNVTTAEIAKTLKVPRRDGGVEYNHKIAIADELQTNPIDLDIPPYLLGVWLGDGNSNGPYITAGDQDVEHFVLELQAETACGISGDLWARRVRNRTVYKIGLTNRWSRQGTFRTKLRQLDLLYHKHIPEIYFDSGSAQRWALLQGLMDTDGTVSRHAGQTTPRCSFANTNYGLAHDVWRLARSLGLKATINSKKAMVNGKDCGLCWQVSFTADQQKQIFRLERKQQFLPKRLGKRSSTLTIISCDLVDTVPTKCIAVDAPDHLFLAGHGCVPTHNTTQCAFILLLHLCGPEAKQNSQLFSCAQSRDQAAILFGLAAKMVRMSPLLRDFVGIRDTGRELYCPELGTQYKALSADATTAFGLSPVLTVFDELGQVKGPRSALYEAMLTSTAAQKSPLTLVISTQSPTDADLLSVLIDDAATNHDPSIVLRLDTAPLDLDPFSVEAIRAANPAFDEFMNQNEVLAMASDAKRMPARESQYRNLVLNQRVEANSPFISPEVWKACSGIAMDLTGREVFVGLDLSETRDLTAMVLIGSDMLDGTWHVNSTFWLPDENLHDKAKQDRIPYDLWKKQGFLHTTPGASISYEYVAARLKEVFDTHKVQRVAFDRWNIIHLRPWLIKVGFSEQFIKEKFIPFGQGFASMSPALRDLESIILQKKLRHSGNPILTMCAHNSVVLSDDAGNRKLSKKRSSGRIDGMVALLMAIGVAPLKPIAFDASALIG